MTDNAPDAPERETGSQTEKCPNCDKTLAVETRADGSESAALCTKCYSPATKKEVAAAVAELPPREVGTPVTTTTEAKA